MSQAAPVARAAVILAAGHGTRMKSPLPKVLHTVGGRSMLDRIIDTALGAGCAHIVVVVGKGPTPVAEAARARLGENAVVVQDPPLGTAHAVLAARAALSDFDGDVLVTNADCPLLEPQDLEPLFEARAQGADLALLGFEPEAALLYGRLIRDQDGAVLRIVEPSQCTPQEAAVRTCYSGMLAADRARLFDWLDRVDNNNPKGEYFITSIVGIAVGDGAAVRAAIAPATSVMGADTPAQLAQAEAEFQARARTKHLSEGVVMRDPGSVHFSWDTKIAPGVTIEPFVVIGPGVTIESGALIRAFSHLEGCVVHGAAQIGPYSRLRPGADIGEDAHIGNFVEVKKVKVGVGAKANHLAYLGDGTVGAGANIGAGTIFCNYDGFDKFETHVGAKAFIGSNSALVAPVRIGEGAMTGSGSVITRDVPADALALGRGAQTEKPGWAARFRALKLAARAKK